MNGRTQKTLPGLSQKRQQFRNQVLTSRLLSLSTRAAFVFLSLLCRLAGLGILSTNRQCPVSRSV